jgi:hypothetical protein
VKCSVSASSRDIVYCPITIDLPKGYNEKSLLSLADASTGEIAPCQIGKSDKGANLTWLENRLKAGETRKYIATPVKSADAKDAVTVTDLPDEGRVDVNIFGKLFTSYHYGSKWVRPFLYPVIGPSGAQVTRNWPIVGTVKGEHRDHVHHKSIWVAYGDCSQVDNWLEQEGHGWQRHQEFINLISGPVYGRITARNDWRRNDESKQFEEIRDMRFYALPGGERLFDINITFNMTEEKVVFQDTKEGGLVSVRVASSMDVRHGGKIENGYGGADENETWGKKAPWCDYSGHVDGKHVGIAVFDHEKNPRYPTQWHVRNYGLMTANCFAWSHYNPEDGLKGDMTFEKNSSTTWRYRLFIHKGDASKGKVKDRFMDYIAPPPTKGR